MTDAGDLLGSERTWEEARLRLTLVVLFSSLGGLGALWYFGWLSAQPGIVVEALIYTTGAWALASVSPLNVDIVALPSATRLFLLVLVAVAISAQFAGGGGDLYPGARWAMFSDEVSEPQGGLMVMTNVAGQEIVVRPSELFGSLRNGRGGSINERLNESDLDDLLTAYARRYQNLNPEEQIKSVSLVRLKLSQSDRTLHVRPEVTHTVVIDS